MSEEIVVKNGVILLRGPSQSKPGPLQGDLLKSVLEYLEKLKQTSPKRYEEIMKAREEVMRQRNLAEKPPDDSSEKPSA